MFSKGSVVSKPGAEHTESIRDSLVCLKCDYSLRGLGGDVVTCPECGERTSIAVMITQQWRDPWFRAPLYLVLAIPSVWAFLILIIAGMSFAVSSAQPTALPIAFAVLLGGAAVWLALIYVAVRRFGSLEAAFLVMFVHLLLGGYVVSCFGVMFSIAGLIGAVLVGRGAGDFLLSGIVMAVCIGIVVAARVGERFVARRCIRQHLRRLSKV